MSLGFLGTISLLLGVGLAPAAQLKPATDKYFDDYLSSYGRELASRKGVLRLDAVNGARERLRKGDLLVEENRPEEEPPGGLIHHWEGAVFVPGAKLSKVISFMQDYDHHKDVYGPEVVDSKTIERNGNDFRVRMRLLKKKVVTVVLETEHRVHYQPVDATRWESQSRTVRVAEVHSPDSPKERVGEHGNGFGFVWQMASFWRFVEADGGVYVECSSITLSRDVPFGMARVVRPVISDLPQESLRNLLAKTRAALKN